MGRRVRIGVTGPTQGGDLAWLMTRLALWRAGAEAVRLRSGRPIDWQNLDGLVLGGGSDLAPDLYNEGNGDQDEETKLPTTGRGWRDLTVALLLWLLRRLFSLNVRQPKADAERDRMEQVLCRFALHRGLPILGICRGAQLLNVVNGGSLHQNADAFYTESPKLRTVLPKRPVRLAQDSRLAALLGQQRCRVNALHDQAVDRPGRQIAITAWDKNRLVQAIEHTERPFVIGVQWHPEYLPQVKRQQRLFRALVAQAKQRSQPS
ncbi:gamma-glutamyl-gamma-aminobutyrate hydrolase family protein [Ferrimonas gelatinilytica]|uniref:Glutamine amidotransferase n=1 Tax=Ferrimonas gelatinilytica TaxID=1255257 RepID=A0ABP9S4P2_9GAMM